MGDANRGVDRTQVQLLPLSLPKNRTFQDTPTITNRQRPRIRLLEIGTIASTALLAKYTYRMETFSSPGSNYPMIQFPKNTQVPCKYTIKSKFCQKQLPIVGNGTRYGITIA